MMKLELTMRRFSLVLYCAALVFLLVGCQLSGCQQGKNMDQPASEVLLRGAVNPASWSGLQPGSTSLSQVDAVLLTLPEVVGESIVNDRFTITQGTFQQEVEKTYFNFQPGNNQRQEMFFTDGMLELIVFHATNVTLAEALKYYGEPEWVLSTSFCDNRLTGRLDQVDLLYPSQGIALQLYGVFSEGIELKDRCTVGAIYLFTPESYEKVLPTQIESGYYLDPQVLEERLEALNQRLQTWRGVQPAEPYIAQPCPP